MHLFAVTEGTPESRARPVDGAAAARESSAAHAYPFSSAGMQPEAAFHLDALDGAAAVPASLDVLGELLQDARPRGWLGEELTLTAHAHRVNNGPAAFYIVLQGHCWLALEGAERTLKLLPGDLIVLPHGQGHELRDRSREGMRRPSASTTLDRMLMPARPLSAVEATRLICGGFSFDKRRVGLLLSSLPPFIHLARAEGKTAPWLSGYCGS